MRAAQNQRAQIAFSQVTQILLGDCARHVRLGPTFFSQRHKQTDRRARLLPLPDQGSRSHRR